MKKIIISGAGLLTLGLVLGFQTPKNTSPEIFLDAAAVDMDISEIPDKNCEMTPYEAIDFDKSF